jgi:hypothetical protein
MKSLIMQYFFILLTYSPTLGPIVLVALLHRLHALELCPSFRVAGQFHTRTN